MNEKEIFKSIITNAIYLMEEAAESDTAIIKIMEEKRMRVIGGIE